MRKTTTGIHFKKENNPGISEPSSNGWLKFIPAVIKARFEKSYATPVADTGNRFHLRLVDPASRDRRHIITRIMRYIPDLSYSSTEDIVDEALNNKRSLIRVVNSRDKAEELLTMFKRADPPVRVEVYDTKLDEVISS
jgi:hypothetical protein